MLPDLCVTRTQQPLALFFELIPYLFICSTSLPCAHILVPASTCTTKQKKTCFWSVLIYSWCPAVCLSIPGIISMFLFGLFFFFQLLLQHWLAQTDFHIKNRGGNAYVWGAGICNCLLAYVKNKAFSVFLFYFQFVTRIWDRCWNSAKSLWKTDWSLFFFLTRTRFHILLSAYNWDI